MLRAHITKEMTDFVAVLERVLHSVKDELVSAGGRTIHIAEAAVKDAIADLRRALDDAGTEAEKIGKDARGDLSAAARAAYADMLSLRADFEDIIADLERTVRAASRAAARAGSDIDSALTSIGTAVGDATSRLSREAGNLEAEVGAVASSAAQALKTAIHDILEDARRASSDAEAAAQNAVAIVERGFATIAHDTKELLLGALADAERALRAALSEITSLAQDAITDVEAAIDRAGTAIRAVATEAEGFVSESVTLVRDAASDAEAAGKDAGDALSKVPSPMGALVIALPSAILALIAGLIIVFALYRVGGSLARSRVK